MEMRDETTVDRFGRVLIPKRVRKALELTAGTSLLIEVREGELALRPQLQEPTLVRKGGVLVAQGEALQQLDGFDKRVRGRSVRHRARPARREE
jgi:AbrB family looped-hinge helix DNA binding protein